MRENTASSLCCHLCCLGRQKNFIHRHCERPVRTAHRSIDKYEGSEVRTHMYLHTCIYTKTHTHTDRRILSHMQMQTYTHIHTRTNTQNTHLSDSLIVSAVTPLSFLHWTRLDLFLYSLLSSVFQTISLSYLQILFLPLFTMQ